MKVRAAKGFKASILLLGVLLLVVVYNAADDVHSTNTDDLSMSALVLTQSTSLPPRETPSPRRASLSETPELTTQMDDRTNAPEQVVHSSTQFPKFDGGLGVVVILAPKRFSVSFKHNRTCLLKHAIESVDNHLNQWYGPYPVVVLYARDFALNPAEGNTDGEYTEEDFDKLRSGVTHTEIHFVGIDMFSNDAFEPGVTPQNVSRWVKGNDGSVKGSSVGYRAMCRLFSGRLQNMAFLDTFTYMMRIDDDSYFVAKLPEDPFVKMKTDGLNYMFNRYSHEPHGIQHLYSVSMPHATKGTTTFEAMSFVRNGRYSGREPYNNFHVTTIAKWRTPEALAWSKAMDDYVGFSKFRFSDANVHAMFIGLFLDVDEVHIWKKLKYVHNINDDRSYPPSNWRRTCSAVGL